MLPDSLLEKAKSEKLGSIARAEVFKKLIDRFGLTTKEIAKQISKSSAYVSNTLRLLKLPEALQDGLVSGLISTGHARALAGIEDKKVMIAAYKQILREEGNVRKAEVLARKMKKMAGKVEKKAINSLDERFRKGLSRALAGAKVELSRSRVQTRISISLKGNEGKTETWLEKIYQRLTKPNLSRGQ